jgi:hypothetical protein
MSESGAGRLAVAPNSMIVATGSRSSRWRVNNPIRTIVRCRCALQEGITRLLRGLPKDTVPLRLIRPRVFLRAQFVPPATLQSKAFRETIV